jgi:hypothetical protein
MLNHSLKAKALQAVNERRAEGLKVVSGGRPKRARWCRRWIRLSLFGQLLRVSSQGGPPDELTCRHPSGPGSLLDSPALDEVATERD